MTDRELMQHALDALNNASTYVHRVYSDQDYEEFDLLIEALRARLAQPELEPINYEDWKFNPMTGKPLWDAQPNQEPVAWVYEDELKEDDGYAICETKPQTDPGWIPLYTAPPRKEWQSLTDDEKLIANHMWNVMDAGGFIRAIETKLKEKNSAPD